MAKKVNKGKYYIIYDGISDWTTEEEEYNDYNDALEAARDLAECNCMDYVIVQGVTEVNYVRTIKLKELFK